MDRWVVALLLVGCGPSVGFVDSTSDTTAGGSTTTTTGRTVTSSAADDSTGQTTGMVVPDTSTSTSGGTSASSTGCDDDGGEDTEGLGDCDPAIHGASGRLWIADAEGEELEAIDIDEACSITGVTERDATHSSIDVSCPSNDVVLELFADPPLSGSVPLAAGQMIQLRAFRDFYIDTTAPHHVIVRDPDGSLLAAYHGHAPVKEDTYPDYLDWFAPLTASDVDLGCALDEFRPPALCNGGFIEVPCPTDDELRGVEISDGSMETVVDQRESGMLGPFELRARATRHHPLGGNFCMDTPYTRMTWTAFRVQ